MAQIQKGTTYGTDPNNKVVTHTNLNAHVDGAILLPGAITDQTALTATAAGDYALVSDTDAAGALKKVTLANLLPDNAVTAAKLNSDAVTTVKILDANVTTGKIADLNVTADKLAADAVTTVKILDEAVTAGKLAATLDLSSKALTLPSAQTPALCLVQGRATPGVCTATLDARVAVVTQNSAGLYAATFATPRSSVDYAVVVTASSTNVAGATHSTLAHVNAKTVNGFEVLFLRPAYDSGANPATFDMVIYFLS